MLEAASMSSLTLRRWERGGVRGRGTDDAVHTPEEEENEAERKHLNNHHTTMQRF